MKHVLEFIAELIVMVACLVCFGSAICVMNGNNNATWLGLVCLAVMVIAISYERRKK